MIAPLSRRRWLVRTTVGAASWFVASRLPADDAADRELRFHVRDEFPDAPVDNIAALLKSVASELWKHCPQTKFVARGFTIYRSQGSPITLFRHEEERIVVGLATEGLYWSQYSYQFAHEFCHCLIDHTHEDQRRWHGHHANHWLDECLCETASLFALRAMSKTWRTDPPYSNWASYAERHHAYAQGRLDDKQHHLPEGTTFADWFQRELPMLRTNSTQREKNTLIAGQLLPLFEAEPAGWESVIHLKRGVVDRQKPFTEHVREWHSNTPQKLRPFVEKVTRVFLNAEQPAPTER